MAWVGLEHLSLLPLPAKFRDSGHQLLDPSLCLVIKSLALFYSDGILLHSLGFSGWGVCGTGDNTNGLMPAGPRSCMDHWATFLAYFYFIFETGLC